MIYKTSILFSLADQHGSLNAGKGAAAGENIIHSLQNTSCFLNCFLDNFLYLCKITNGYQ